MSDGNDPDQYRIVFAHFLEKPVLTFPDCALGGEICRSILHDKASGAMASLSSARRKSSNHIRRLRSLISPTVLAQPGFNGGTGNPMSTLARHASYVKNASEAVASNPPIARPDQSPQPAWRARQIATSLRVMTLHRIMNLKQSS
jgi:hypothetical protein